MVTSRTDSEHPVTERRAEKVQGTLRQYDRKDGDLFTLVRPDATTRIFTLTNKGLHESQIVQL